VIITRVRRDGELEYVNCGHVPPLLVSGDQVTRPQHGNLPVGLLADAQYESDRVHLKPGDRFILVTDGVTEAENAHGEFYDNERLEAVAAKTPTLEDIFASVSAFCAGNPLETIAPWWSCYIRGSIVFLSLSVPSPSWLVHLRSMPGLVPSRTDEAFVPT
jgi:hypothetical protein